MMKINMIREPKKKVSPIMSSIKKVLPSYCLGMAVALVLIGVIWGMHYIMYDVPPTVITGVVIDASQGKIEAQQLIRGNYLAVCKFKISYDGENWARELPITCDQMGAVLVSVKKTKCNGDSIILETMIIVQDYHGQCDAVYYGP